MKIEIAGVAVGLAYLYLEYKASVWLWAASIVMPAIYIFVYYGAGLYADCAINVYYLLASAYGAACWLGGSRQGQDAAGLPIRRLPGKMVWPLAAVAMALFIAIAAALIAFTDSTVPLPDSLTTALSVVAMWMLAKKYAEQWLVWIAVDVVSAALYAYKGLPFTSALYALYAAIAWLGYRKWIKLIPQK